MPSEDEIIEERRAAFESTLPDDVPRYSVKQLVGGPTGEVYLGYRALITNYLIQVRLPVGGASFRWLRLTEDNSGQLSESTIQEGATPAFVKILRGGQP